ncbi:MAG: hypothetical protein ACLU7D_01960 [Collinsella sp.]
MGDDIALAILAASFLSFLEAESRGRPGDLRDGSDDALDAERRGSLCGAKPR